MDPLHVVRVCRIDQYADYQNDVARVDLLPREGVAARVIDDLRRIHVLIHDLHRHEVLARIRQDDGHGPRIKIENPKGKECVALRSHDSILLFDRPKCSVMGEFAETSILDHRAEIMIGLGPNEVVRVHRDGVVCPRLCLSFVDKSQRRQCVNTELGLHVLFSFCVQFIRLSGEAFHVASDGRTRVGQGLKQWPKLKHSNFRLFRFRGC